MSTLRREPGTNPPVTTQLIGRANGKEVVMSFTTFKKLARFDTGTTSGSPYHYPIDVVLSVEKANEEEWKVRVQELFVVPYGVDEKGVKVKLNPHKISFLVHASEWKYELRRKMHRLIDEKSQRYLEAPREDVEEIMSESDNEAEYVSRAPEPVVSRLDPRMQRSAYQSYNRDQMIQSHPGTFANWSEENQLIFVRKSQEIVESRVHRRAMMHQQELFRNQDFMYLEQIRHD
ncbi:hypothetical protein L1987_49216 [Smallanthus sonchifolius]|uniref:Uncharacterized protein n=1 Tax=Smallanthus sonchifolius TaxID=185202 RepID=A0ACB9FVR0_9ASTR|nr:hypothetical protein L1987_49216 [Smallanthus sonchifolius]